MADAKALYQAVILDHNRMPRNFGVPEHASHQAVGDNPLCGDHISVALALDGERIAEIGFQGDSCAICKASASMMTVAVKGTTRSDAERLIEEFRDMATGRVEAAGLRHIGRLAVFAGVRFLPARVKCALLPWHTLHAALHAIDRASTEGASDLMHAPIGDA
jgi:nitrogen fixation protein NifU and related proteins